MANGIPALLSSVANVTNNIQLAVADAELVLKMFTAPPWGIYLNGVLAIVPDSFAAIDFKADSRISDYQQEAGAFQSYNKVQAPYDVRVTLTKGGTNSDRAHFLAAVDAAYKSLNLYYVLTPDAIYLNVNVDHVDYRRTEKNGVGLLTVDLWMTEVRVNATAKYSNTKAASGADPVSGGNVQAQPATSSTDASQYQNIMQTNPPPPQTPQQAVAAVAAG